MYRATKKEGLVFLEGSESGQFAKILPALGNTLISFSKGNREIIHFPDTPDAYAPHNSLAGNPLLHPWANRLEGEHFWWQGNRYNIPREHIPMRDNNYLPLHGLLYKSPHWRTTKLESGEAFALHEAHLDFAAVASYMTVFPFAHELTMRHWMEKDTLTISLEIYNTGEQTIPICCGFHPYFSLAGYSREEVKLTLPVTKKWITNNLLLPTGQFAPVEEFVPGEVFSLSGRHFDDGYTGINSGQPFVLETPGFTAKVVFGDTFPTAIIYAPNQPGKPYICIEPMSAPTNALQLSHYGLIEVPSLSPGKKWNGWFSIQIEEH